MDTVDEVVNRHHAPEAAPCWACVGEAVNELDAGGASEARQQLLLTAHPFGSPARAHRNRHAGSELLEEPITGLGRLAVHEQREPELRSRRDQLRQQFARHYLGATGLSRHQIDQVEADVATAHAGYRP